MRVQVHHIRRITLRSSALRAAVCVRLGLQEAVGEYDQQEAFSRAVGRMSQRRYPTHERIDSHTSEGAALFRPTALSFFWVGSISIAQLTVFSQKNVGRLNQVG